MTRIFLFLSTLLFCFFANAQTSIPLVYDKENTGAHYPKPVFPSYDQLPVIQLLPDPFKFFDGGVRNTSFESWEQRRNEIMASIEKYEIGPKPDRSDLVITAAYTPGSGGGTLTVHILRTTNGVSLTLNSKVSLPTGTAPAAGWPAVIGMALAPSAGPVSSSIAKIDFLHDEVTTYAVGQEVSHASDPYFLMYPEYYTAYCPGNGLPCQIPPSGQVEVGQYSAWSWGVSRLIDGMEIAAKQVVNPLPIDIKHLGVEGCSYAGKMALYSSAFDERIAATFAHESGGGGATSWRASHFIEPEGTVEKASNTNGIWFKRSMKTDFGGNNVYKFPHDHHELMAMVAPRALFVSGNTDYTWLSNRSNYVASRATQKIYETLGVGERFGFWIDGNHGHCGFGTGQQAAVNAFWGKYLLGQNNGWSSHVFPQTPAFTGLDYEKWYNWWGTNNSDFPPEPSAKKVTLEAECGTIGSDWDIVPDATASNGKYVTVKAGLNSTGSAPTGAGATIVLPFRIDSAASYNIMARVNCATADDDSYWVKIDDGAYVNANGLASSGWSWATLTTAVLSVGQHTLTIAYREDGAKLDKVLVTTSGTPMTGIGDLAINCGNQPPAVTPAQTFSINDRVENGAVVGTVTGTDPEGATLQDWQITGGTGAGAFSINSSTGEIRVSNKASLDFENSRSYTLKVTVSDGESRSEAETVVISIDYTPVITPSQTFHIKEWVTDNYVVGNPAATDKDENTILQNWRITGGSGASYFGIDDVTGQIKVVNSAGLNQSSVLSYTLLLTVSDGTNTSAEEKVIITLSDKVNVCHSGNTLHIGRADVQNHINHGDKTGACTSNATTSSIQAGQPDLIATGLNNATIQVYPNPVRDVIHVNLGANAQHITLIQVVDLAGKVLKQVRVTGESRISIHRENLSPGFYMIRLHGDKISNHKIVLQ